MKERRRRRFSPRAGAGALGVLGALAVAAISARGRGRDLDRLAYRRLNAGLGPAADALFGAVTELGSIWASAGAAAALGAGGRRREGLDALGAAGVMWALGQALKGAYLRPRPYSEDHDVRLLIAEPRGTSWPSSHPAVLLAFLTVACRSLGASKLVRAWTVALSGAVGASRIYLGVHYPSDVLGGMLLGRGVADLWWDTASWPTPRSRLG